MRELDRSDDFTCYADLISDGRPIGYGGFNLGDKRARFGRFHASDLRELEQVPLSEVVTLTVQAHLVAVRPSTRGIEGGGHVVGR